MSRGPENIFGKAPGKYDEITALEEEVREHEKAMKDAERRLHEARSRKVGIQVGGTVLSRGRPLRVTRVEAFGLSKPWIYGNPQKDGSWGKAERCAYSDWEHIQPAEAHRHG